MQRLALKRREGLNSSDNMHYVNEQACLSTGKNGRS